MHTPLGRSLWYHLKGGKEKVRSYKDKARKQRTHSSTLEALSKRVSRLRQAGQDVTHSQAWRDYLDALNNHHAKDMT
jgi:ATP-dependent Lon protease